MDSRLQTALVVFVGIAVLVAGKKVGIDPDVLTAGSAMLILVAGRMQSMVPRNDARTRSDDTEKKP